MITQTTKAGCRSCRYSKCIAIGMKPELPKTKSSIRKKLVSDDAAILDDSMMDNDAVNDDKSDQENEINQMAMEKPEEPSVQSKAETFVEFMSTVKEGTLKCKNICFYFYNRFFYYHK